MNILTLTVGFPDCLSGATISGEVKNAYTLVKLLERKGHQVFVVSAPTIWQRSVKSATNPRISNSPKGLWRGVVHYLSRVILMTPPVYRLLRDNRIDVIHCHSPIQFMAVWLARAALPQACNIGVFVTAHGTYLPEFQADIGAKIGMLSYLKKINSWVQYRLDRFAYGQFRKVIVTSEFQIQEMMDIYKIPEANLRVINNPAAVYFDRGYRHGKRAVPSKVKRESTRTEVLFVGRFVKKKGLFNLIKAIGILTKEGVEVRLSCVGGGMVDEYMMREIKRFIDLEVLSERIQFLGEVSELGLARLYRDSDCLVVPSIGYESIPTVVIEGIKCGITVFATGKWGIPEVLVSRDCWLKEDSVEDIVKKIGNFTRQHTHVEHQFLKRFDGGQITILHEQLFSG